VKSVFFVILFLSFFSFEVEAQNSSITQFSTSKIQQQDISHSLQYVSIGNSQLPKYKAPLADWLKMFNKHNMSDMFKDRYVTAFEIHNDTQIRDWFIHPYGSVVESIQVAVYQDYSPAVSSFSGLDHTNIYPLHYGSKIEIPFGESVTVLMVFNSDFFFAPIKIALQADQKMQEVVAVDNIILFLCIGVCLALGIYNLFIYLVMRDNQYLYYALSTLFYTSGWAAVFGIFEYLHMFSAKDWLMSGFLLGSAFSAFFQIEFFRLNVSAKPAMYLLLALGCLCLLFLPLAIYSQALGLIIVSIMTSAVLLTGLTIGIISWSKGYRPARYFTIAILCVIIPNLIGNLLNLRILSDINLDIYLLGLMGIAADTLILAFALAEKMRLVNSRNAALKQQLEYKVKIRTQALSEANTKLAKTNQELVEANSAKDHFLANMSHEIRTPLTSIIGYADGILLGDIDKAEQERVTNIIYQNGAHLLRIINDILDLSKIDANKLEFDAQPCHLFTLLGEIESVAGKRARDKGIGFHVNYDFPLPDKIITDAIRLKQILFNLTNNALKFTQSGHITLNVSIANTTLIIKVIDTGEGISQSDMHKLFHPFTQADSVINRQVGGTGLGLSIAKRLAQGLGGDISALSQLRKGSTFAVSIKLVTPKNVPWLSTVGEIDMSNIHQITHETDVPKFAACNVLLADDHPNNRELVALLLKRMNINVVEVADGHQALQAMHTGQFDLLLLDIHMPELDGIETLKAVRGSGNKTPAIALTANTMKHEVDHYLRIGFADHLAKPIDREVFFSKVSRYLNLAKAEQANIDDDKMLPLVQGYITDLRGELGSIEQAWHKRDLAEITASIHKIKGAAGSFGLANIGDVFSRIEKSVKNNDEVALQTTLPQALRYAYACINMPGVDVALAVVNFNHSFPLYLAQLPDAISQCENQLGDIAQALRAGDDIKTTQLIKNAQELFNRYAFEKEASLLDEICSSIACRDYNSARHETVLQQVRSVLESISRALESHIKNIV